MKANKVFVSAPISMDWSTVLEFYHKLDSKGLDARLWNRDCSYDQKAFDDCGSIVFLLPNNKFNSISSQLPVGLKSELCRSFAQRKNIYVGYITSGGEYNIYEADTNGGCTINGISGTANSIFRKIQEQINQKAAVKLAANSMYGGCGGINPNSLELPTPTRVCAQIVTGHEFEYGFDERLLLAL